jgi:hypothetical protein
MQCIKINKLPWCSPANHSGLSRVGGLKNMEMLTLIPQKTLTGQNINKKILSNSIMLWTKPKKGGTSSKITVPSKILTDKDFWIGIGLFLADGTKPGIKNKEKSRIAFTNGDPKQVNKVLGFFEHFGINRNNWKGVISANSYYIPNEKEFKLNAVKYWFEKINIPTDNMNVYFYNRKPKKNRETLKYGTIQIRFGNIILNSILWNIIDNN